MVDAEGVNRALLEFVRRTAAGAVLIVVGVPMLQNQVVSLSQANDSGPVLTVTGNVTGLEPGRPGRLLLTVHNSGDAAAVISHLRTDVANASLGCTLTVRPWSGTADIAAGGSVEEAVAVVAEGSRCAGAAWSLRYTVS